MVLASVEVARMIIVESFFSYLGLGVPPPAPSWGGMLSEGQLYVLTKWVWLATFSRGWRSWSPSSAST